MYVNKKFSLEIADRNLFSGDFVIPSLCSGQRLSASEGSPPFSPNRFFN
jgi:hypothetical protein